MLQGEGKGYPNCKPVEDSQKHFNIWDQRFQVNWEAPQINEIISDFDFSKELFEGYQENMCRKSKWVWISKSHLFQKTFLKSNLQKYLEKLYSKCCKIFKTYLTS